MPRRTSQNLGWSSFAPFHRGVAQRPLVLLDEDVIYQSSEQKCCHHHQSLTNWKFPPVSSFEYYQQSRRTIQMLYSLIPQAFYFPYLFRSFSYAQVHSFFRIDILRLVFFLNFSKVWCIFQEKFSKKIDLFKLHPKLELFLFEEQSTAGLFRCRRENQLSTEKD